MTDMIKSILNNNEYDDMGKITKIVDLLEIKQYGFHDISGVHNHSFKLMKYYNHVLSNLLYDAISVKLEQIGADKLYKKGLRYNTFVKCDKCFTKLKVEVVVDFVNSTVEIWCKDKVGDVEVCTDWVDMNPLAERILLDYKQPIFSRFADMSNLFRIELDESIKSDIHVFEYLFQHHEEFSSALYKAIVYAKVKYTKANGGDINAMDYDLDQPDDEFFEYVLSSDDIKVVSPIKCSCCNISKSVDVYFDFVNMCIKAVHNEEYEKRAAAKRPDINYGNEQLKCVDIYDKKVFTYDFNCPSGKVVLANIMNDLPLYAENELTDYLSINHKYGMMKMIDHWQKHNFMYMQCGNTSPTIHINDDCEVMVGRSLEYTECEEHIANFVGYSAVGCVCTDLWAVHMVDYNDFVGNENLVNDYIILDVSKLGTDITIDYHYDYMNWNSDENVLFTMRGKVK